LIEGLRPGFEGPGTKLTLVISRLRIEIGRLI